MAFEVESIICLYYVVLLLCIGIFLIWYIFNVFVLYIGIKLLNFLKWFLCFMILLRVMKRWSFYNIKDKK